jgi:hypothetical protein
VPSESAARKRSPEPFVLFTGIVFLSHLLFWWLFRCSREVQAWSFFPFLFLLLQPIILYLLAGLCFPDFSDRGPIDLREFYYRNHRWFFGLFALLMVLISLRDILFRAVPWISQGNAVKAGVLVIALVGVISSRPWIHAILALLGAIAIVAAFFTFGLAYG